ncbi:hypothetical protein MUK70_29225 [Dyadobacter chenwenxiniae]|uniref:Uncharacterized protein n=1 Tax=Dyadobacter chenwenxiniae TaxID=2906456 RepID=A0A9X1PQA6_9BACT|nr:hypothetical protein [Dyadobacter chenwenxiniae]MCF0064966.1 hypothetical protein [Dyadobacter chenwenxiniae]UON83087.1 hypothetical protein MUK70_29225 [Dyadobacter chenwenxiniae]
MKGSSTNPEKQGESKPIESTVNYIKEMFLSGPASSSGKGLEMGVSAILAKTALRRLPPPLNYVVPLVVKNVLVKHGVPEGRELLLKGLRWVKRNTEEKPVTSA